MALRISSLVEGTTMIVRIEGRLETEFVPDLWAESRGADGALHVDLSGLQSADRAGIRALRSLRAEGAVLDSAAPCVRVLLDDEVG